MSDIPVVIVVIWFEMSCVF